MKKKSTRVKNKPRGWIIGAMWGFPIPMPPDGHYEHLTIPVDARVVRVVVGQSDDPKHWAAALAGEDRMAVEVTVTFPDRREPAVFYLDNADGQTPERLTLGRGAPDGLRQLPVLRLVDDPTIKVSYKFDTRRHAATA